MNGYLIWAGQSVPACWDYIWIVIFSLVLHKIAKKLTCMAYVVPSVYFLDQLLVLCEIKPLLFNIAYIKLIVLIGVLHFMEGILTFFFGSNRQQAIITYRENEIAGGYQAYGRWIVPLLFFTIKGIYVPILAGIVYFNETFTHSIGEKAQKMGIAIAFYGVLVLMLNCFYKYGKVPLILVMVCIPILHEALFIYDKLLEQGKELYTYPKKGIRLMGFATIANIPKPFDGGDIILEINFQSINSEEDYNASLKDKYLLMHLLKISGEEIYIMIKKEQLQELQPVFLPPE